MSLGGGNSLFTPDNLPESKSLVDIKPKRPLVADSKRIGSKVCFYDCILILL